MMFDLNMLSGDSSDDEIKFDNRTTSATFQERLRQAQLQEESINEGVRFENYNFLEDTDELRKIRDKLLNQVNRMESRVESMEKKLEIRRDKRIKEAGLTNMTPEERAAYAEQEEQSLEKKRKRREKLRQKQQKIDVDGEIMEEEDKEVEEEEEEEHVEEDPDWDVVFEYMLLLGSDAVTGTDYLIPSADIREKAFKHEDVLRQTKCSSLKITAAKNILEHNPLEDVEIRHCDLSGISYDQKFHVTFDVAEPLMTMSNLSFEVDIEMQLEIGDLLQRIKDECHIMGFFRLLVHYAKLDKQRKDVLYQLAKHYSGTPVHVETLSSSRLKLEGNSEYGINLIFTWNLITADMAKEILDANIETHVQPILTLEAVALSSVIEKDNNNMLDKINDIFASLIKRQGVFKSIEYIVNKTLI